MTRFNGLSIGDLASFLKALNNSVPSYKESKLVLSKVKGNCYAPVISTRSKTQLESVKTLHSEIASGRDLKTFNKNERIYYSTLKRIMVSNDSKLSVYDEGKDYFKSIEYLEELNTYPYFYETNVYKGYLTKIGSRNMQSKNTIFISSYPNEIEISFNQDDQLRKFYKNDIIEFYITEKISKNSGKVKASILDGFKVIPIKKGSSIYGKIEEIRKKYGSYFSEQLTSTRDE